MDIFKLATPPESDVIEENSPLVTYVDFHKISFLQIVRGAIILVFSEMMQKLCRNDILKSTPLEILFLMKMRRKKSETLCT